MPRAASQRRLARDWPAAPRRGRSSYRRPRRVSALTDELWRDLSHHLVASDAGLLARHEARRAAEGVLWVLGRGLAWRDLPAAVAPPSSAHRHWKSWMSDGRWLDFWGAFVARLDGEAWLRWSRALVRAGEELARSAPRGREAAARYAWWVVSARILLWGAGWVPGEPGFRRTAR